MNKCKRFGLSLVSLLSVICCFLGFSADAFAESAGTEQMAIELTAEEQDLCNRIGEITIGCPVDNCPILFLNEKTGQLDGISIDILNMIAEETGLTFRYQALPSGNVTYQVLQKLGVDMIAGVEYNGINMNSLGIAMTEPYIHTEKVFVCKRGTVFQPDGKMTVAIASGSQTIKQVIQEQYPDFQVIFYNSTEEALNALLSGQADTVLQNQYVTERMLSKPIYEDFQVVAAASVGDSQCLASVIPIKDRTNVVSEDTALLLSVINKGIARLDSGKVSFVTIKGTVEHAYRFTPWDILYRYRVFIAILLISVLIIVVLLRKNISLHKKHADQLATQQRAKELAAVNERMKEQQLLLLDSLKLAEEGNRAKTRFLFNMSHDIRTPMNAILGFAEIAKRNLNDKDKLANCVDKIQASGKSLQHLIDNVLDMSKLENGDVALTEDVCSLKECVEAAWNTLLPEIESKQLKYKTDLSDVINDRIYCDKTRITHILSDLLSNAVKFNKQGGSISLTANQQKSSIKEYALYEIHIKDTGIGMNKEFLSRIFEPFERERTSTISKTQGVGLGMSITKSLVELMGGTIQVFSEVDEGTEFVLKFTFKIQDSKQPKNEQSEQEQSENEQSRQGSDEDENLCEYDFSGKRLLLVEDNELNMEIAVELLRNGGFLVESAQNGQIATEMAQKSAEGYYDAILMDIQMPVMDGYQATHKIRSLGRKDLSEIPIIALTANVSDEDKKEALSHGMNAHITKPLDVKLMYEVLANVLHCSKE